MPSGSLGATACARFSAEPRLSRCCGPPSVLLIAWLNNELYGSPLRSGYGDASSIYSWQNLRPNLTLYPAWLWESQGPLVFLFLFAPLAAARRGAAAVALRLLYAGFIATLFACYVLYRPFEWWWYLRFLLPAFPLIFILAADSVWNVADRFGAWPRRAALVVFAAVVTGHGAKYTYDADVVHIGRGEQKYADVGRYVARELPANAIVFADAAQRKRQALLGTHDDPHDSMDSQWLDRAIEYLRRNDFEPYFVIEDWEVPLVKKQFATQKTIAVLDGPPLARTPHHGAFIYRTDVVLPADRPPNSIPATSGCDAVKGE